MALFETDKFGQLDVKFPMSLMKVFKEREEAILASRDLQIKLNKDNQTDTLQTFIAWNDKGYIIFYLHNTMARTKPMNAVILPSERTPKHVSLLGTFLGEKSWTVRKSS